MSHILVHPLSRSIVLLLIIALLIFSQAPLADLEIYNAGSKIYWSGGNPYSIDTWNSVWAKGKVPAMVWNPPFFFVLYAPIYFISRQFSWALTILSVVAIVTTIIFAWRMITTSPLPRRYILALPLLSIPFLFNLQLGQITAFLNLILVVVLILYGGKKDFLSGLLLSLLVVKPHVFYLTLAALGCAVIIERRFRVIFGAACGIACLVIIAEGFSPGIHTDWLGREVWPMSYAGSTLCSLIRASTQVYLNYDVSFVMALIPCLAVAIIIVGATLSGSKWAYKAIPCTILVSPILAPYGFLFDQSGLIIPMIWLLAKAENLNLQSWKDKILLYYAGGFSVTLLFGSIFAEVTLAGLPVWWFVSALYFLLFWCYAESKLNSSLSIQESIQ